MRKVTVENYRADPHYSRVVAAVTRILATSDVVAPIEVFVQMGLLTKPALDDWRHGRVPFLERAIQCNLEKAARLLRILRMHAHDLNLRPSETVYCRHGTGPRTPLRFTKFGDARVEAAYRTHLIRVVSKKRAHPSIPSKAQSPKAPVGTASEGTSPGATSTA